MEMAQPTMTAPAPTPVLAQPKPKSRRGCVTCLVITLVVLLILMFLCSCCSFAALSLAGAKGQAGTIIKPSTPTASTGQTGNALAIPTGLGATGAGKAINLKWDAVGTSGVNKIRVYRSDKPDGGYAKLTELSKTDVTYADSEVKKGTTYYYVITALGSTGAESGNSARAAAVIDVPPLISAGVYSWADVKAKATADDKYLQILNKVTGLQMSDVDRLVAKEKTGQSLKTTLVKGTLITNTMEDFRVVANFILTYDRDALTDENGKPWVLTRCGNPMKLQAPVTPTAVFVQQIQGFVTTVVMVLPPPVTNILINTGQAANGVTVSVLPGGWGTNLGPGYVSYPTGVFVDPASFGDYTYDPDTDIQLDPGQQWIEQGKLLVSANPADPAPQETVAMTVKIFPAKAGVSINYNVAGTDGYTASGTIETDANGEITFTIPGGGAAVSDTVNVAIPSDNLSGSVQYTF